MSIQTALSIIAPPDLLRRFVPTPYCESLSICGLSLLVITNDERLLRPLRALHKESFRIGEALELTIVSDAELMPSLGEPIIVCNEKTILASFGRACFTVIEPQKKTITGFISAEIGERDWAERLLPALLSTFSGAMQ